MADTQTKIDAAAEKAFADAAEKKTAEAVIAKAAAPVATPVVAEAPKPVAATPAAPVAKVEAPKVAAKPVVAKKAAPKKKTVAKAKPVAAKKAAPVKKAAVKNTKAPTKKVAAKTTKTTTIVGQPAAALTKLKDTIMATAKKTTDIDFTAKAKEAVADIQTRAKAAYDKGSVLTADAVEFQKGNLEALVASGKILAAGVQDLSRTYVEEAKSAFETVQADVKKVAAIKTPTELFQLQGEIARRNFDAAIATASKNSEAFLKLANEAFAPVSSRMSLAAEKFSKAA